VYSLIKTALLAQPGLQLVLIYANRSIASTIFYKGLSDLESRFAGRFKIEWLFSASPRLERARLSKWLLGILLKEHAGAPLPNTLFYLCGPFDFMRMAAIRLRLTICFQSSAMAMRGGANRPFADSRVDRALRNCCGRG